MSKPAMTRESVKVYGVYYRNRYSQWVLASNAPCKFAIFGNIRAAREFRDGLKMRMNNNGVRVFRVRVNVEPLTDGTDQSYLGERA